TVGVSRVGGDGVDRRRVPAVVGGVGDRRVLRRGGRGTGCLEWGMVAGARRRGDGRGPPVAGADRRYPSRDRRAVVGRFAAADGQGVRPHLLGAQVGVAVVGARVGAGGRHGDGGASGGGGSGPRVLGGARGGSPHANG